MGDFYGIEPGMIPSFTETGGGTSMSVGRLPDRTVANMMAFMDKLRQMHKDDPLAFEVCVQYVAAVIEGQRRGEGRADPRDTTP